jgi:hypothetical protein
MRAAWLLTGLTFALLVIWSAIVPIFESPDEPAHWQYVRHLHDARALPVFGPDFVEANSPPLYYALLAPFGVAAEEPPHLAWFDHDGGLVVPAPPRFYLNASDDGTRYWVLRRARLLSAALAATTVIFTFLAAREVVRHPSTALLAAALVGFLPQFTFRGMSISNDALVTPLGAASLYGILQIARRGFTWRAGVWTTLAMTGAFLAKINAIFMPAVFVFAVLREPAAWSIRLRQSCVLAIGAVLAAPWLIRNQILYGDPLAVGAMLSAVGPLIVSKPITSPYFYTVFPQVLGYSFIGLFGWLTLPLPVWIYRAYFLLGGLAIAGWVWRRPAGRRDLTAFGVLVAFALLALAIVVRINLLFDQPQGRYLFPALAAFGVLVAGGLERLPRWSPGASYSLVGVLLAANLAIALRIVMPGYWPAPVDHLSTARRSLDAFAASDLTDLGSHRFRITGADPSLTAPVRDPSSPYLFLEFEIGGYADGRVLTGAASFGSSGSPPDASRSLRFTWKADGVARVVRVPLFLHPEWSSGATAVRIDPVERASDLVGSVLSLDRAELRGTPTP